MCVGASLASQYPTIDIITEFLFCPPQPSANSRTVSIHSKKVEVVKILWRAEAIAFESFGWSVSAYRYENTLLGVSFVLELLLTTVKLK